MEKLQLQDIYREIKRSQKKAIKETYKRTLSQFTLEKILNSGAFHENEVNILREYMEYRGSSIMLNENSIKMIDNELLDEGVIDWLKDKGKAALDTLKSGWDGVKKAWGNFKDFTAGVIQQIKEAFKKLWEWMKEKVKKAIDWVKEIPSKGPELMKSLTPEQQKALPKEANQLTSTVKFLKDKLTNVISGGDWEGKIQSGDLKVGNVDESIFEDKELILTLKEVQISEAGMHPEDLLKKYPTLQKVLHYTFQGLMWVFNFPVKLAQTIIKMGSENILERISILSAKLGGPGPFAFAVTGLLIAEGAEILGHSFLHDAIHKAIDATANFITGIFAWAGPIAKVFGMICVFVGTGAAYYAGATIILTTVKSIINLADKVPMAGAEDAVKVNESLTPEFLRMQKLAGIV